MKISQNENKLISGQIEEDQPSNVHFQYWTDFKIWITSPFRKICQTINITNETNKRVLALRKKQNLLIGYILIGILVFLMTVGIIIYHQKNKEAINVIKLLEQKQNTFQDLNKRIEREKYSIFLNLSHMNVNNITLRVDRNHNKINKIQKIYKMDLTNNSIENFSNINLPDLQTLVLYQNPLKNIENNNLFSLKEINFDSVLINRILNTNFNNLQWLQLKNQTNLKEMRYLNFQSLKTLSLPQSLEYFKNIYSPSTQTIQTDCLIYLKQFSDSTIKTNSVILSSPKLSIFENITFLATKSIVLRKSTFEQMILNKNKDLVELIVEQDNKIKDVFITETKNLSRLIWRGKDLQRLFIQQSNLTQFGSQQLELSKLTELTILKSNIKFCDLNKAQSIKQLILSNTPMQILQLPKNNTLTSFKLQKTLLKQLQNQNLSELKTLHLINNPQFRKINTQVSNLKQLFVDNTQLSIININHQQLQKLTIKQISNIDILLNSVDTHSVEQLTLINNQLLSFPFQLFPNLKTLKVSDQTLEELSLVGLQKLIHLEIKGNLRSLSIQNSLVDKLNNLDLPKLKYLTIKNCSLSQINTSTLVSLNTIELIQTNIKFLVGHQLKNLKTVIFKNNTDFQQYFFDQNNKIKQIHIQGCKIKNVSSSFYQLQVLNLTANPYLQLLVGNLMPLLSNLSLNQNPNLTTIQLRNNSLTKFNDYNFQNLQSLSIADNPGLFQLQNNAFPTLKQLNIQNTNLQKLQNQIPILQKLCFKDNLLSEIPKLPSTILELTLINTGLTKISIQNIYEIGSLNIEQNEIQTMKIQNAIIKNFSLVSPSLKAINIENFKFHKILVHDVPSAQSLKYQNIRIQLLNLTNLPQLKQLMIQSENLNKIIFGQNLHNLKSVQIDAPIFSIDQIDKPLNIEKFVMKNTMLQDLVRFQNKKQLKSITIQNNILISQAKIYDLPNLKELNIYEQNLNNLSINNTGLNQLSNLNISSLQSLELINNVQLTKLSRNYLQNLKILQLTNLSIDIITNSIFPAVDKLFLQNVSLPLLNLVKTGNINRLSLKYMDKLFTTFDYDLFNNLTQISLCKHLLKQWKRLKSITIQSSRHLKNIVIHNNQITDYLQISAPSVQQLQIRDCHINPLRIRIKNIKNLILHNINLKTFKYSSSSLNYLQINDNSLNSIELNCPSLQNMDLLIPNVESFILNAPIIQFKCNLPLVHTLYLLSTSISQLILNQYSSLSDFVIQSNQEMRINIINSSITSFRQSKIKKIKQLIIHNVPAKSLPSSDYSQIQLLHIINCKNMTIDLTNNLQHISSLILNNVIITQLSLNNTQLKQIKLDLPGLTTLQLIGNGLKISNQDINIPDIKYLTVQNIQSYDFSVKKYTKLETLRLINTTILQLSFTQDRNSLKQLFIHENKQLKVAQLNLNSIEILSIQQNNLEKLSLFDFNYQTIDEIYEPKIEEFIIKNSNIQNIHLSKFPQLKQLTVQDNYELKVMTLPTNSTLQQLVIINTPKLSEICLLQLRNLISLHLQNIPKTQISNGSFLNLQELTLIRTSLRSLQSIIMPYVRRILIKNNELNEFTECIYDNLLSFLVNNSTIKTIPTHCSFKSLQTLQLNNTQTTQLPDLNNYLSLQRICLKNVQISELSNINLQSVQFLNIQSNSFIKMSNNSLENIFTFLIMANKIEQIQVCKKCSRLQNIVIFNCNVPLKIDADIYQALKHLTIRNTNFTKIKIKQSVQQLIVQNQVLSPFPLQLQFIGQSQLLYLKLDNCNIKRFENNIIYNLKTLEISNNRLLQQFKNNNFPKLINLILQNNNIKIFTHNKYQKLLVLKIINTPLQEFHSNNLPNVLLAIITNTNITQFNQNLPQTTSLNLNHNKILKIDNIFQNAPLVQKLQIINNHIQIIQHLQSHTLQLLNVKDSKLLKSISNNNFPKLKTIDISDGGISSLLLNNFPLLQNIYSQNNYNFSQWDMLSTISTFKATGTKLSNIYLEYNKISQDCKNANQLIYKDANFQF